MPELPEVETVRRGLEKRLFGQRVTRAEARRKKLRIALPERFAARFGNITVPPGLGNLPAGAPLSVFLAARRSFAEHSRTLNAATFSAKTRIIIVA